MAYWDRRDAVQGFLAQQGWRGWLLMDFRGSNPLLWQVLGRGPQGGHLTRRTFLWIPAGAGEVVALPHDIERGALVDPRWTTRSYTGAGQPARGPRRPGDRRGAGAVAMEYSPLGEAPYVSRVDGGTLDLVRSLGAEVVSSADLLQLAIAQWDERQVAQHDHAAQLVDQVKDEAFRFVGERLRAGAPVDEHEVAQGISAGVRRPRADLRVQPHRRPPAPTAPTPTTSPWPAAAPHRARRVAPDRPLGPPGRAGLPFADVTWVAWTGPPPSPARAGRVRGGAPGARPWPWSASPAPPRRARPPGVGDRPRGAGLHRRGRLRPLLHPPHRPQPGAGGAARVGRGSALTTSRRTTPGASCRGVAFSVEPGIYLPADFGVRLELNAVMTASGPRVYTPVQREIITLT